MKNLKTFATTMALAGIIMMGVSSANAGLLMSDFTGGTNDVPCGTNEKVDSGILMSDATGIIVSGFTGIIVSGFTGIIVSGVKGDNNCVKVDNGIMLAD